MKLAHTNHFVARKYELGQDNCNYIRPARLATTPTLKIRRPLIRLVARWHVCPATRQLECTWSLEPVGCDSQLCRSRTHKRGYGRGRTLVVSALGQKQTCALQNVMSALHPIATAKAKFRKRPCPLYTRKRTCAVQLEMSALGQ